MPQPIAADYIDAVARELRSFITTAGRALVVLGDLSRNVPDLTPHVAPNRERIDALAELALITANDLEAIARAARRLGI